MHAGMLVIWVGEYAGFCMGLPLSVAGVFGIHQIRLLLQQSLQSMPNKNVFLQGAGLQIYKLKIPTEVLVFTFEDGPTSSGQYLTQGAPRARRAKAAGKSCPPSI